MAALLFHGLWKRERSEEREGQLDWGHDGSESGVGGGGAGGAEGIWFGASRASFLACRIP